MFIRILFLFFDRLCFEVTDKKNMLCYVQNYVQN